MTLSRAALGGGESFPPGARASPAASQASQGTPPRQASGAVWRPAPAQPNPDECWLWGGPAGLGWALTAQGPCSRHAPHPGSAEPQNSNGARHAGVRAGQSLALPTHGPWAWARKAHGPGPRAWLCSAEAAGVSAFKRRVSGQCQDQHVAGGMFCRVQEGSFCPGQATRTSSHESPAGQTHRKQVMESGWGSHSSQDSWERLHKAEQGRAVCASLPPQRKQPQPRPAVSRSPTAFHVQSGNLSTGEACPSRVLG